MATTFTSRGWPTGATVTVYKRPVTPGAALGSSVASGTADGNGEVTFTGLTDSTHYQATDGNRTVGFRTDDAGYVPGTYGMSSPGSAGTGSEVAGRSRPAPG
jgi:hypothetical protein